MLLSIICQDYLTIMLICFRFYSILTQNMTRHRQIHISGKDNSMSGIRYRKELL